MRAFIAVPVSDEVKRKMEPLCAALAGDGITPVAPECQHVTLFFLGEIDERRKDDVIRAMESILAKKFILPFSGAGAFPNPNFVRVVWVGCESPELLAIYNSLAPFIERMGYQKEEFRPHLTVARVKSPAAKERVQAALKKFRNARFGSCEISRVVLFESKLSPAGPMYVELHSKELG